MDEDLPRSLAQELSAEGLDAVHVRDLGLQGEPDSRILTAAQEEGRVLISGDHDFSNRLRFPPESHSGIVIVRDRDRLSIGALKKLVRQMLNDIKAEDLTGCTAVIHSGRVRIRRKP